MPESNRSRRTRCKLLLIGCSAALAAGAPALAQDDDSDAQTPAARIEEVVVIGSRARVEMLANELPVGVDAFQGVEVERAGEINLGAALTKLAPSFNYSRQAVGDGVLLHAATLRGLSPDQTLVLINGKRRHSMAWLRVLDGVIGYGAGGTDLAAIPSSAVGRVEVLRDGTAAFFFNGVDTETQGADLVVSWEKPTSSGRLLMSANANVNKTRIVARNTPSGAPEGLGFGDYFGGWTEELLEHGQPRRQANLTVDWERAAYGVLVRLNHYGATTQHPLDTGMIRVGAATTVDVEARFRAGILRGALGVNNLADELPTELPKTHLSNILWGIRYPTETPFGLFGRFVYLRLSTDFSFGG